MTTSERQRNIRHLTFLANDIYLLRRVSERFIENAPIDATRAKARKYVEPFVMEVSAFRNSITETRRKLIGLGVNVPKSWAKLPIKLATQRNPETDSLELDSAIIEQWAAILTDIDAEIEQLTYSPEAVDGGEQSGTSRRKSKWSLVHINLDCTVGGGDDWDDARRREFVSQYNSQHKNASSFHHLTPRKLGEIIRERRKTRNKDE